MPPLPIHCLKRIDIGKHSNQNGSGEVPVSEKGRSGDSSGVYVTRISLALFACSLAFVLPNT